VFLDNGAQLGTATLSGNPAVAKFNIATLALGTHPITATYAGDSYNTAAQSGVLHQVVTLDAFSVTVTPAKLTLKTGANATVTVVVDSIGGYGDSIVMGCASLPRQVTCEFKPLNAKLPANGRVTAQLTIDTNNPLSGGPSAMNRAPGNRGAMLAGLLPISGAIFGWIFWRQRRKFSLLKMVLVLAVSGALLTATGCGNSISLSRAAPGTYTIQVSGTGGTSFFTRYQDVNLTITQ
jgi:large repetitive protein